MMVALPIMQLLLFGYAINTDVRHIPTVVFDQDDSAASRDLARSLEATGFYDLVGEVSRLRRDRAAPCAPARARVALVVPPALRRRSPARPRRPRPAGGRRLRSADRGQRDQHRRLAGRRALRRAGGLARMSHAGGAAAPLPIELEPTTWYNPDLRTAVFIVPGLVGVILTMTMVMLTAMAIARERERGTLEQLIVSPVENARADGRQDPALRGHRLRADDAHPGRRRTSSSASRSSARCRCSTRWRSCSSPPTWRSGCSSPPWPGPSSRRCRCRSSSSCPTSCFSGFMFPFEGMPRAGAVAVAGAAAHPLPAHRARRSCCKGSGAGRPGRRGRRRWRSSSAPWSLVASLRFSQEAGLMARPRTDIAAAHPARRPRPLPGRRGRRRLAARHRARRRHQHRDALLLLPEQGRSVPRGGRGGVRRSCWPI